MNTERVTSTPDSAKADFELGFPAAGLSPLLVSAESLLPEEKEAEMVVSLSGFSSENTFEDIALHNAVEKANKSICNATLWMSTGLFYANMCLFSFFSAPR